MSTTTDSAVAEAKEALGLEEEGFDVVEADGSLVAQPSSTVVYMSRRRDLVLVLRPRFPQFENGIKVGETRGLRAKFRDSQFKLDRTNPEHAEVMELLERHRLLGNMQEGFWRAVEPAPEATPEEMQRLVDAAIGLDVDVLQEFIRQESEGFAREDVLKTARMALARVEKVMAASQEPVTRPADPADE